jgi:hypothetical protein
MSVTCTHCTRINPRDAVFCYHDGRPLDGRAAGVVDVQAFPRPLVLPSGRACRTFDQLALACQEEWDGAAALLRQGALEQFLGGIGRADLALAARAAAEFPDTDRGLDQLLARLPSQALAPPRLHLAATEINLGIIKADADQSILLRISNNGMRLLHGTIASGDNWLVLGDGPGAPEKLFQCTTATTVTVRVLSKHVRAGNQGMEGRLLIDSNGGSATVMISLEVTAKPFAHGVLAGAITPRQLAEKARKSAKEAAGLFADGSVAAWYRDNGWSYPVQGPSAAGLGAVQQFFEALGLARPPRVEVCDPAVALHGYPGQTLVHTLQVRTAEKRPIYAHAASDQPWLTVGTAELRGTSANLPLKVVVPDQPSQRLQANVTVTANGGQRFVVPVSLTVAAVPLAAAAAVTVLPIDTAVMPPAPAMVSKLAPPVQSQLATQRRDKHPAMLLLQALHLLPLLPLLLLLLAVLARDVLVEPPTAPVMVVVQPEPEKKDGSIRNAPPTYDFKIVHEKAVVDDTAPPLEVRIVDEKEERQPVKREPVKVEIKGDGDDGAPPPPKNIEVDRRPRVVWQYHQSMRFGITAVDTRKKLTYSSDGWSNQTLLRVNGENGEFGDAKRGKFTEKDVKLAADAAKKTYGGSRTTWVSGKMVYTQIVELVPSKQPTMVGGQPKLLLDTVRVRYIIENKDSKAMKVGLRMQLDTLIGGNDGVPFTVPGLQGLVTAFADFPKAGPIPDFIQALEMPNLQNPGTVAHLSLKLGGGIEAPSRVSLTHWPGANFPDWDVPLSNINEDSAVILYWPEQQLKPGQKREVGFAYGLGSVSSEGGKLGLTIDGNFEPGESFTVTAYVQNPQKGQTLTIDVPSGLERIEGEQTQEVPPPVKGAANSIVSWKVKVLQTGTFPLKVTSSTGISQSRTITIARPEGAPDAHLTMNLIGSSFEPGTDFFVEAKLTWSGTTNPSPPKLTLPKGLGQSGAPESTSQPLKDAKGTLHTARWKVQVLEPGTHPIRVEWQGVAVTKTLTLTRPETALGGYVSMEVKTPAGPGKPFTVTASVTDPVPGQTLTLELPDGLRLVEGKEVTPVVKAGGPTTVVNWKVMVDRTGTYPLRLVSSTGVTLKKTITLEKGQEKGGGFDIEPVGKIAPGAEFMVKATVTNPVAGQKLSIELPAEMEVVDGPEVRPVPAAGPGNHSVVTWQVRVTKTGTMRVQVTSTTGPVRAFTITLTAHQAGDGGQIFGGKR